MTTIITTSSVTAGTNINLAAGEDLYIAGGVTRASEDDFAVVAQFSGHAIDIQGDLYGETAGLILGGGDDLVIFSRVAIGPDGSVAGRLNGLVSRGDQVAISNLGQVSGNTGLTHSGGGSFHLFSGGSIIGAYDLALYVDTSGGQVENTGTISSAFGLAVRLANTAGTDGQTASLINHGIITAGGTGVSGDNLNSDLIRNFGSITGDVVLRGRDDVVVNGGLIDGRVDLGDGNDLYRGDPGGVALLVSGGAGDDRLFGADSVDQLLGGDGQDSIAGRGGDDLLDAGAGDDRVAGGDGDDVIVASAGRNTLLGGAGDDTITAGGHNDLLQGATGDDVIMGDSGRDTLHGGDGADILDGGGNVDRLVGGRGDDVLTGGGAADAFVFTRNGGDDRITDFTDGLDDLDLTAFGFARVGDVRALASDVTGGLLLDLTSVGGGTVLLEGFAKAQLTGDDMLL